MVILTRSQRKNNNQMSVSTETETDFSSIHNEKVDVAVQAQLDEEESPEIEAPYTPDNFEKLYSQLNNSLQFKRPKLFSRLMCHVVNYAKVNKLNVNMRIQNIMNTYKLMNFYMSNYSNEYSYSSGNDMCKNFKSNTRYELGKISYKKALETRASIMKDSYDGLPEEREELNKVLVEYIQLWLLNEYKWFPLSWRKEQENILL